MSSTTYSCEDCNWSYKKGRGMGTGSGNSGVHPRKASNSGGNTKLVQTGVWCSTCDTSAKPGYCRCVENNQTGLCKDCAKYSEHDVDDMLEVCTYFGKYKDSPFTCEICEDHKAELKIV